MKQKTIAVIPAYNESEHIANIVKRTKKYVNQVIVVDDGSKDNTSELAHGADIVLRHIVNIGKGFAMRTGFEAAILNNANIVIFLDADGQHKPEDIPQLITELNEKELDMVSCRREFNKNMPLILRVGNWGLVGLFNFMYHSKIHDISNGFRAIKTDKYNQIKWDSSGYSVETEILAKAHKYRLKNGEIPIDTIYLNKVKGTTVFDGINMALKMAYWKMLG
jgi:glycosyltransferase involved in cell wall biosynthesis